MAPEPPPPPRGGLSLYANLLESSGDESATISRAPVVFKATDIPKADGFSAATKKTVDSSLRFQPIRRPVINQQKKPSKPIMPFPKIAPPPPAQPPPLAANKTNFIFTETSKESGAMHAPETAQQPITKPTLADWAATIDDDAMYYGTGESKRKRNKKKKKGETMGTDWDELYDPMRPTNVEEYMRSDERIQEVREWKDTVLYKHKINGKGDDENIYYSEDEENEKEQRHLKNAAFAPPPSYKSVAPPPSPPSTVVPINTTGEDAYVKRLAMSVTTSQPTPPQAQQTAPSPCPAPSLADKGESTISRAPIRYNQAEPEPMDEDKDDGDDSYSPPFALGLGSTVNSEEAAPKSSRPGQAGFAERLMSKYGWSAGTGLGANSSGIVNPLRVRVEKQQRKNKRLDSGGNNWESERQQPQGGGGGGARGKIVGGQVSRATKKMIEAEDSVGKISRVIILSGMVDNMTDEELADEIRDGDLQQEIGGECGEKYGRVERLHVDTTSKRVYIKFTDQVSALRAVNELQGRVFNGNAIVTMFFDEDRFEKMEFL